MRNSGRGGIGILIAVVIAIFSLIRYFGSSQTNEVTGEKQRVGGVTAEQEIALGLQAKPQMMQQFGGESRSPQANAVVDRIGQRLVDQSSAKKSPYRFEFHLLDDDKTINAFALPGGQVFVTEALAQRLKTEGELAGVLGHEIGHVIARH
ncbi:M48 family metalloprotease, partial [Nostoc sp. CHAB 5834]|nr:M48 family metalloprotease [Nostoc sp. CHAB 5834]